MFVTKKEENSVNKYDTNWVTAISMNHFKCFISKGHLIPEYSVCVIDI